MRKSANGLILPRKSGSATIFTKNAYPGRNFFENRRYFSKNCLCAVIVEFLLIIEVDRRYFPTKPVIPDDILQKNAGIFFDTVIVEKS